MKFHTAELCDRYAGHDNFQIAEPVFKQYGLNKCFSGQISTLKVFEDNTLVRTVLEQKVTDRVLVIDGGGAKRCALIGDTLAALAVENGWQGIIVYGCIRGADIIAQLPLGVLALNTHPLRSHKHGQGEIDVMITFAGVNFKKDQYLYADSDGLVVSDGRLEIGG
jgi:regulator of ribonuclease activity A